MIGLMKDVFVDIGVGELCTRLDVPYRHVRYVMEQGILPAGVDPSPDRGHHRLLDGSQAFWLGIVLKLKASGVRTPLAGKIASYAAESVRTISQNLNWDTLFAPHQGRFRTEFQWYCDIGDLKYVRIATNANPSKQGLDEFPWSPIGTRKSIDEVSPVVTIRLDITRLAKLLANLT